MFKIILEKQVDFGLRRKRQKGGIKNVIEDVCKAFLKMGQTWPLFRLFVCLSHGSVADSCISADKEIFLFSVPQLSTRMHVSNVHCVNQPIRMHKDVVWWSACFPSTPRT